MNDVISTLGFLILVGNGTYLSWVGTIQICCRVKNVKSAKSASQVSPVPVGRAHDFPGRKFLEKKN